MKRCTGCHELKPLNSYDSQRNKCKRCRLDERKPRNKSKKSDFDIDVELVHTEKPIPPPSITAPTIQTLSTQHALKRAQRNIHQEHRELLEHAEQLRKQIDFMLAVKDVHNEARHVQVGSRELTNECSEIVPMATASDWHVEERVDSAKVHGLNEYNPEIAWRRAEAFADNFLKLIRLVASESRVNFCVLNALGDFFSGTIHAELMESNHMMKIPAIRHTLKILHMVIKRILDKLPEVTNNPDVVLIFNGVGGNHGRATDKIRISTFNENNFEIFLYQLIADHYEGDKRIQFNIATGPMLYVDIFQLRLRLVHGWEVKSFGGVGGITIPIRKKIAGWDKARQAHLTIMGHFHQLIDGGDFIVNGSGIGYNDYAMVNGFSPEPPRQSFCVIHSRNGGEKALTAPIWMDVK